MVVSGEKQAKTDLRDLSVEDLKLLISSKGLPSFRGTQLTGWLYGAAGGPVAHTWEEMKNLPQTFREVLGEEYSLRWPEIVTVQGDLDETMKLLLRLGDGETIECVLIPETIKTGQSGPRPWRRTLCVSSQVGCAMGCTFCRTATMSLKRNLTQGEILAQVLVAREFLREKDPEGRIRNLVFMGMGEPLHNYRNVLGSIRWLTSGDGLGFAKRRITVSTSGLLPEIQNLISETEVRLAISLNATTEETRLDIMPVTKRYSLEALLDYCRKLSLPRAERITFEYVLLAGINDSLEDAKRLVSLLHGIRAKVNLLAFNEFPGSPYRRPSDDQVEAFRSAVQRKGLQVNVRQSRGRGVLAACGQLRSQMDSIRG